MKIQCRKCKKLKDENVFAFFNNISKRRTVCNVCASPRRSYYIGRGAFLWKTATEQEKFDRLKKSFDGLVIKKEGCWGWKGFVRKDGYTRLRFGAYPNQRQIGGHVVSYVLHNDIKSFDKFRKGKINVLHKCDNPTCCNPDHLYAGSHKDNMIDMAKRKRRKHIRVTVDQVKFIKVLINNGFSVINISKSLNINECIVKGIKRNACWKHVKI